MPEGQQIQKMFSKIARRYDFVNHALSLGMDFYWWRRMAQRSGAAPHKLFLDVAAGTGDSSIAVARLGAEVISTDFTHNMLRFSAAKSYQKISRIKSGVLPMRTLSNSPLNPPSLMA